jgi:hypothetical protein
MSGVLHMVRRASRWAERRSGWRRTLATIDRPWTDDATEEDIYYCFRLILGRTPNREELKGHFARAGQDLAGVVRSYVRSPVSGVR